MTQATKHFDVIIIGAGAAGMMCAGKLAKSKLKVALVDHAKKIGEKIRISGGGKCNFTNINLTGNDGSKYYISNNPRFVRHALSRYSSVDFITLLKKNSILFHEKHKGQLFCDHSSQHIIDLLKKECHAKNIQWFTECTVKLINKINADDKHGYFKVSTSRGDFISKSLIIATGGLAIPLLGSTPFGYEIAKQFGHNIIMPTAALVPLKFDQWENQGFHELSGISLLVEISCQYNKKTITFKEDLLFRHKGLSGPAILQISNYWKPGSKIKINLAPDKDLTTILCNKKIGEKIQLKTALLKLCPNLPTKLVEFWLNQSEYEKYQSQKWADIPNQILEKLANSIHHWIVIPSGSDGHKKAEATKGGVDVNQIDPKTMESKITPNLYFIGEVMDITGWLGGYNFQWAWSSAVCSAKAIIEKNTE